MTFTLNYSVFYSNQTQFLRFQNLIPAVFQLERGTNHANCHYPIQSLGPRRHIRSVFAAMVRHLDETELRSKACFHYGLVDGVGAGCLRENSRALHTSQMTADRVTDHTLSRSVHVSRSRKISVESAR